MTNLPERLVHVICGGAAMLGRGLLFTIDFSHFGGTETRENQGEYLYHCRFSYVGKDIGDRFVLQSTITTQTGQAQFGATTTNNDRRESTEAHQSILTFFYAF